MEQNIFVFRSTWGCRLSKKCQSLRGATVDHKAHLVEEELEQWRREKELEKSGIVSELSSYGFLMTGQKNILSTVVINYKISKKKVQMHLLIHSYARKIGQSRLADLLAPVQFGLANKAELYWRRGCCKESLFIIIIIKERNNFEHFVCIYTKGREEKKIMERSQTLSLPKELRSVPWKVAGKIWLKCSANTCCRTFMSSRTKDQKKYRERM